MDKHIEQKINLNQQVKELLIKFIQLNQEFKQDHKLDASSWELFIEKRAIILEEIEQINKILFCLDSKELIIDDELKTLLDKIQETDTFFQNILKNQLASLKEINKDLNNGAIILNKYAKAGLKSTQPALMINKI